MLQRHTSSYRNAIAALAFSSFLVFCNLYAVQPLLSRFSEQFQVSETVANWVFASGSLGISGCLLPWAVVADRLGRKAIMLASLGLTAVASFLLIFSQNLEMWIGLRIVQGIALAGLPAVAVAYISEECEKNAVLGAVGVYIAANTLGGVSGRVIGGALGEHFGVNSPMIFCAVITLLGVFAIARYLPKEQQFQPQSLRVQTIIANLCEHVRNPRLWRAFLIGGIAFGMFINLFSVVGLRLEQSPWNFSTTQVSLLFLCYLSGTFTASQTGKLSQKFGVIRTMWVALLIFACGIALTTFASLPLTILGLLTCSIGFFLLHALASSWVGNHATKARALASALYLSAYYLGASLGGFYLLYFYQHTTWLAVPLSAEMLLLIVPWLIWGLYKHQ